MSETPDPHDPGPPPPPPWQGGPEITEGQLAFITLEKSAERLEFMLAVLKAEGSLTVIPDP
jgi:hypothetical protein